MTDLVATIHSIEAWLKQDEHNVVFVHCSDGKVRRTCIVYFISSEALAVFAHACALLERVAVSAYARMLCVCARTCVYARVCVQVFVHSCMHMRFRSCVHVLVRFVLAWELVCVCVSARSSVHV